MCNKQTNQTNKVSVCIVFQRFSGSLRPIWFLNQWPTLHFVSSRSFSQKRAAVEKDYALVRQSSLLLVWHDSAFMFVETSFLNSSLVSVPLLPFSPANRAHPKKNKKHRALRQAEKCLPPMCQVCFLSVAGSQLPKPTRLKGSLGASRALFRFCSPVRNLQPLCEELGVVCSRPSACPRRWLRTQGAHMLLWFSTEEKLTGGSMPGWKSLSPVCTHF